MGKIKMKIRNTISGLVKYSLVFLIGYYFGGGCEKKPDPVITPSSKIEQKLKNYETRIENLENKTEKEKSGVEE